MTNRTQSGFPEAVPLTPVASVNPKEMDFAIQLFEAGLRMKIPVTVSETCGVDIGDNTVAQIRDKLQIRSNLI